jgi:hypothetical protein
MMRAAALLDGTLGTCRRDLAIFRTYPMRPLSLLFSQVVSLTLFFYISCADLSASVPQYRVRITPGTDSAQTARAIRARL